MPRATAHTRDGTAWQPLPRPLTSIELWGDTCLERTRCLSELGLDGTLAVRFDSGEVWHATYGWLDESAAKGWVNPTPEVAADWSWVSSARQIERIPQKHDELLAQSYDALHPVGCERFCDGAQSWPGEWQALGGGWWRRMG